MISYTIKWIGGHNGHWEIFQGGEFVISCDENELYETLDQIGA